MFPAYIHFPGSITFTFSEFLLSSITFTFSEYLLSSTLPRSQITISTFIIRAFPFLVNISLFRDCEHHENHQDCQDGQDRLDNQDHQDCSCADCQDQYNQDEDCQDHLCSSIPGSLCLSGHSSHQLLGHSNVLHLKTYSEIKVHRRPVA